MKAMSEANYARDMIEHHRMAVKMSEALLLRTTPRPLIKAFAEKVIAAQTKEIKWLQEWLERNT